MRIQINTKKGKQETSNAISNLNAQMNNIHVKLATQKSLNNINKKSSSINVSQTLDNKVKQLDKEKENLSLAKNRLTSVASQLKSIQNELKQISPGKKRISGPAKELSEIAKAIKAVAIEADLDSNTINSFTNYDNVESDLAKVIGSISNLEQKLYSKDMFLTTSIANAKASLSKLIFTENAINQLNNNIKD